MKNDVDEYLKVILNFFPSFLGVLKKSLHHERKWKERASWRIFLIMRFNFISLFSHLIFRLNLYAADKAAKLSFSDWTEAEAITFCKWSCTCRDSLQCSSHQLPCALCWHAGTFNYFLSLLKLFYCILCQPDYFWENSLNIRLSLAWFVYISAGYSAVAGENLVF